jgi:hypothetical protein
MKNLLLFLVSLAAIMLGGCATRPGVVRTVDNHVYEGVIVNNKGNHFPLTQDNITITNNVGPGYFVEFRRAADVQLRLPYGKVKTVHPYRGGDREKALFSSIVYTLDDNGNRTNVPNSYHQVILDVGDRDRPITVSWVVSEKRTTVTRQTGQRSRYSLR